MALTEPDKEQQPTPAPAAEPKAPPPPPRALSAPGWLLTLYLGGLVLVYVGERVLSGLEKGAGFFTGLGVLAVLGSTLLRFSPRFRSGGERVANERLLAGLSVGGVAALVLYGLTTDWGMEHLGLGALRGETGTRIQELLTVLWISLIVLSTLPMIFAETALRPMRSSERPESRRVRAAAAAGLTLAMAAVYGTLCVYAAAGVDLDVDFSYFKTSRASESTKKIAASLTDTVRVVAFFPQVSEVRNEVERYFADLKPSSKKLQIEVQDRLLVPKLARELRANQDGVIVLSKGTVNHSLTIGTELEQAKLKLKTLDRDFQEQLTKLSRSRRTVYFTVGHGELNEQIRAPAGGNARSASIVKTLLQRQNLQVKDLGLGQGLGREVPDDADLVLVLGPTEPFAREELDTLRRYGGRGGKLFIALDADAFTTKDVVTDSEKPAADPAPPNKPAPQASGKPASSASAPAASASAPDRTPPAPTVSATASGPLDELARTVGLAFSSDLLANERMHVRFRSDESDRARLVVQSFSSHASVSTLSRNAPRAAVIVFGSGSLERAPGTSARTDFTVRSPSGTFADKNRNFSFESGSEKQAVYNIAAAVTKPVGEAGPVASAEPKDEKSKKDDKKSSKKDVKELRAFVLADADALSDFVMGEVLTNQLLLVDAVRWLIGDESVAGLPNTEEDQRIQHTKQEDLAWFYTTIFGAPALVLALGVFVSRRSRRQKGGRA